MIGVFGVPSFLLDASCWVARTCPKIREILGAAA
jgi:hypothetical protein